MILTCNDCEAKFLIKAEDIGDKGRRVRCGACGSVWFEKPAAPVIAVQEKEIAEAQTENLKEVVRKQAAGIKPSLPTVYEPVAAPKWLKAAVVVLTIANVGAFIFLNKSLIGQTTFYDMVGQYQTADMAITNASLVAEKGEKKYAVQWSVINNSKAKRDLPARRIKLLDKDLNIIKENSDNASKVVEPGQIFPLPPNNIPNKDGKVKYVVLEIGNPYELMRR